MAFDSTGIEVGPDGIRRYTDLPRNVVTMLRTTVERYPQRTAVVELGGPSLTYQELGTAPAAWPAASATPVCAHATGSPSSSPTASTGRSRSGVPSSPAPSSSR